MKQLAYILYVLIICTLFVQLPVYEQDGGRNTLNLYHVLIAITFALTMRYQVRIKLAPEFLFFVVITTTSAVAWAVYGVTTRAVLLPIIFLSFTCGYRWAIDIDRETRLRSYGYVFIFVIGAVAIRNLIYLYSLPVIYSRVNSQLDVFYLASGGRNLEATLLGMLAILVIGTRWFTPALALAFVTSVLMLSRAGLIAVVIAMLWWAISSGVGIKKFYLTSLVIGICLIVVIGAGEFSDDPQIIQRFNVSDEQSLAAQRQGRLAIWSEAIPLIKSHPLGFGVGNGFTQLNTSLGMHFRENNAHNIFVELSLDGGLQSSILFLIVCLTIFFTRNRQLVPEHRIALAYVILGLVEFTGYDAIGWFFIGAACGVRLNESAPLLTARSEA
jgi:hypothetical protein